MRFQFFSFKKILIGFISGIHCRWLLKNKDEDYISTPRFGHILEGMWDIASLNSKEKGMC